MKNSNIQNMAKKKKLLVAVLEYFLAHNDFPTKSEFRYKRVKSWPVLDEMERDKLFIESYSENRDKYVIGLKALFYITNEDSKKIIKVGNLLIPALKKLYRKDRSESKYWPIEEVSRISKIEKKEIQKALVFLKDMYVYIRNVHSDASNKYLYDSISIGERVLEAKSVEDFFENYIKEKIEKPVPLLLSKVQKNVKADYGEDRLVAFLDVLGFKEIIKDKDRVELYFNKITTILKTLKTTQAKSPIQYALISDSVVLSFPFGENLSNVKEFFIALGRIQADLCLDDIWLRGAVTIGSIKMQKVRGNQVVFGQGLSDAYILESNYAKFPRILIDPKIFQSVNKTRQSFITEVGALNEKKGGFKNVIFDPSFRSFFSDKDVPGTNIMNDGVWINYFELIRSNKNHFNKFVGNLKKNLYAGQGNFEKYKWVHSYSLLEYISTSRNLGFDKDLNDLESL